MLKKEITVQVSDTTMTIKEMPPVTKKYPVCFIAAPAALKEPACRPSVCIPVRLGASHHLQ